MNIFIEILLLAISLWSAHLAGAHFALSRTDPSHKREGILRSAISIFVAVVIIVLR